MNAPNSFVEAVLEEHFETAKKLLSDGIDINARYGSNGWTALHYAVENMIAESVRWLVENGADPNYPDPSGWTPLHLAIDVEADTARQEYVVTGTFPPAAKLIKLLLRHGANPNARTNKGKTPLMLAQSQGNTEAVQVLKRHGALDVTGS